MCRINIDQPNAKYINPMTDYGFKKLFGDKEVLIAFLTDLLKPKSPISQITYIDKEMMPESYLERGVIYDLRCKTEDGGEFIVEMQNKGQIHFSDRILYYLSRSISAQGVKGKSEREQADGTTRTTNWDFELQPVYGIFFMNFHLKNFQEQALRTIDFVVRETGELFTDKMRAYTIELPCFNKSEEECTDDLDYWTYILNHMEMIQTELPFTDKKPIFQRLGTLAEIANMPTDEREKYQRSLDAYRTNAATYAWERAEGRREGRAEGLEEGIEIGVEKGILIVARKLKAMGKPYDEIAQITGLSPEDIEAL